jgi:hypothetical protein
MKFRPGSYETGSYLYQYILCTCFCSKLTELWGIQVYYKGRIKNTGITDIFYSKALSKSWRYQWKQDNLEIKVGLFHILLQFSSDFICKVCLVSNQNLLNVSSFGCTYELLFYHSPTLIQLPPLLQPLTTLLPSSEWFNMTANTDDITDPLIQQLCPNSKPVTIIAPATLYVQWGCM